MVYQPGDLLWGQYLVQRYIGSGGMAEVYHVKDGVGADCAAKIVRGDLLLDSARKDRFMGLFREEAEIHAKLNHPHIVRCYRTFVDADPPGMVVQYVNGENLRTTIRRLNNQVLPNETVLHIVQQISSALMHMHEQQYCHCDLKPGNILQDQAGNCYLTDFGVSQPMGRTAYMKGTWYYMAPEQFGHEVITPQTDVYSFAITIYEMITGGYRPFTDHTDEANKTGESRSDTLREQHLYVDPPPPSHFNPDIRPAINTVMAKALAKDPRDRHPTPDALVAELEQAFKSPGVTARIRALSHPAPTPLPQRPAQLVCTRGHYKGRVFPIEKKSILIGRNQQDCDIEIPERPVSRRHVLINWAGEASAGGAFYLQDQGSTYKTRVNGRIMLACRLSQDDLISIVGNNFRFEYVG